MRSDEYAEMARRWVRRAWVEAPPRPPADRRRLVGAVEQALRARARWRVTFRWGTGIGAVTFATAAALVLAPRLGLISLPGSTTNVAVSRSAGSSASAVAGNGARTLTVLSATGDNQPAATSAAGDVLPGRVAHGMTLEAGVELMAPESGQIRIGTAEGTALTLEPGSRLTVSEDTATQRFALRRGAVRARVAKLHAGERFLINTSDAEIEVHGTAFRVALVDSDPRCAGGSVTRVSVSEGVVTVRSGGRTSRLLPGDEWPKNCVASSAPGASASGAASAREPEAHRGVVRRASLEARARVSGSSSHARAVVAAPGQAASSPSAAPTVSPAPTASEATSPAIAAPASVSVPVAPPSALAAQNDLFGAAVRAKRQGRSAEAIRLFAALAQQYPNGPLVESALAQRMKLLGLVDPQAGASAATDYLARFPGGFARGEARSLAQPAAKP